MKDIGQEVEDAILIKEYLAGNDRAFTMLYERYKALLYSYLNRLLDNDRPSADDLFQQTWIHWVLRSKKNWTGRVQEEGRVAASSSGFLRVVNGTAWWVRAGFGIKTEPDLMRGLAAGRFYTGGE